MEPGIIDLVLCRTRQRHLPGAISAAAGGPLVLGRASRAQGAVRGLAFRGGTEKGVEGGRGGPVRKLLRRMGQGRGAQGPVECDQVSVLLMHSSRQREHAHSPPAVSPVRRPH